MGGTRPAVLNAANEVAVEAFLSHRISFPKIWATVAEVLECCPHVESPDLDALIETDALARRLAGEITGGYKLTSPVDWAMGEHL